MGSRHIDDQLTASCSIGSWQMEHRRTVPEEKTVDALRRCAEVKCPKHELSCCSIHGALRPHFLTRTIRDIDWPSTAGARLAGLTVNALKLGDNLQSRR